MPAYAALVVEHFDRPRNVGRFEPGPNVVEAKAGSVAQGTSFHLSAWVESDIATAVRFEAYGCPHCIAAGSWTTERISGRSMDEVATWSWREVAQALEIPPEKRGHLLLLEDAVRRLAEAGRARV